MPLPDFFFVRWTYNAMQWRIIRARVSRIWHRVFWYYQPQCTSSLVGNRNVVIPAVRSLDTAWVEMFCFQCNVCSVMGRVQYVNSKRIAAREVTKNLFELACAYFMEIIVTRELFSWEMWRRVGWQIDTNATKQPTASVFMAKYCPREGKIFTWKEPSRGCGQANGPRCSFLLAISQSLLLFLHV